MLDTKDKKKYIYILQHKDEEKPRRQGETIIR